MFEVNSNDLCRGIPDSSVGYSAGSTDAQTSRVQAPVGMILSEVYPKLRMIM